MMEQKTKYGGLDPMDEPEAGWVHLTDEENDLQACCDVLERAAGEEKEVTAAFVGKVLVDEDLNYHKALLYVRKELNHRGIRIR
jgi:predicted GNAT family N-acyltransferase